MTLKGSSKGSPAFRPLLHELWWVVRRYWWVSVTGMLLIFLSTYGWLQLDRDTTTTFALINGDAEILPRITGVLYGIFAAFCLFRFLWNKQACVLTLSVGTARWKQFTLRYLFGLVSVAAAVVIPLLLAYQLEMRTMGNDPLGVCLRYTMVYLGALLTLTVLSYTVGTLIAILCGYFLPALLSAAGVLIAPYALLGGLQKMVGECLFGSPLGETLLSRHTEAGLFTMLAWPMRHESYDRHILDKASHMAELLKQHLVFPTVQVILLLVLTILLAVLAGWAYCRRPAEQAGKAVTHPVLSYAVALTCGFGVASLALFLPWGGTAGLVARMILLAAAFVPAAALIRWSLIRDLRQVLGGYPILGGGAACCLFLTILLASGWFGYADYVPDAEDVLSARVTYNQNPTLLSELGMSMHNRGFPSGDSDCVGTGMGKNDVNFLYMYGAEISFESLPELTEARDVETALSIHKAILDAGRLSYTGESAETHGDSVVYAYYHVVYQLKNGKTVERYYPYLTLDTLEMTMRVEDTHAYRQAFAENHKEAGFIEDPVFELGDAMFSKFTEVALTAEEGNALVAALDADMADLTFGERYFHTGDAERDTVVGILRFKDTADILYAEKGSHPFNGVYATYYLTAAYGRTLAFLEERGLLGCFENSYAVEEVRIQRYEARYHPTVNDEPYSYVFFANENTIQAFPPPMEEFTSTETFYDLMRACTTIVDEADWDRYMTNSRSVALLTRPGTLVQIKMTNADGDPVYMTRYLYDTDCP